MRRHRQQEHVGDSRADLAARIAQFLEQGEPERCEGEKRRRGGNARSADADAVSTTTSDSICCIACNAEVEGNRGKLSCGCGKVFHVRCVESVRTGITLAEDFVCVRCAEAEAQGLPKTMAHTRKTPTTSKDDADLSSNAPSTLIDASVSSSDYTPDSLLVDWHEVVSLSKAKPAATLSAIVGARPAPYTSISRCKWMAKRPKLPKRDDHDPCGCLSAVCCGLGCMNRSGYEECVPSTCEFGDDASNQCRNRPMQRGFSADVEVRQTPGKGFGLFASQPIERGDFIIEYIGEVIDDDTCIKRLTEWKAQGVHDFYIMELAEDVNIDASKYGNKARFANHSCSPNAAPFQIRVRDERRIGLFAEVNIPNGAEITFDYMWLSYAENPWQCMCGSESCRKVLGANKKDARSQARQGLTSQRRESGTGFLSEMDATQYGTRPVDYRWDLSMLQKPLTSNRDEYEMSRSRKVFIAGVCRKVNQDRRKRGLRNSRRTVLEEYSARQQRILPTDSRRSFDQYIATSIDGTIDEGNPAEQEQEAVNEDHCYSCLNLGNLLCCDFCTKSFHRECGGKSKSETDDCWMCPLCQRNNRSFESFEDTEHGRSILRDVRVIIRRDIGKIAHDAAAVQMTS